MAQQAAADSIGATIDVADGAGYGDLGARSCASSQDDGAQFIVAQASGYDTAAPSSRPSPASRSSSTTRPTAPRPDWSRTC